MATSYTDQLATWVKEKKSTPRNKNLVAFLAVRDDIKAALDAGFPVKTVWENMHELKRIEFGYDTFLNYVNRQIRRVQANKSELISEQKSPIDKIKPQVDTGKSSAKTSKPGTLPGFTFNPIPNEKELF